MKYYKRLIDDEVRAALARDEAIFILGARQVGKTTLMKKLMSESRDSFYLDLENPEYLSILNQGAAEFKAFLDSRGLSEERRNIIFIDEIQYANDFSSLIKYFVDHYSERYKLILSGSSSLQIRQKFKESLVGRKIIFELYPLSFSEYCEFKNETKLSKKLNEFNFWERNDDPLRFDKTRLNALYQDFLIFGGFPKVVLENKKADKIRILQDIVTSYILKDIRHIFKLEKTDQFNHLVRLLATIMGKELNFSKLATEIKLHKQTLQHYINALEQAYIIKLIQPYYKNLVTELRKTPKCFFLDNGIRNLLINNFSEIEFRTDRGELLENCIFSQLQKKAEPLSKINYWRTKNHQEVDFILREDNRLIALEVKWNKGTQKNIRKFDKVYSNSEIFMVSINLDFDKANNTLPAYLV
ncbi:MAG: ATP-binding protein [Candidatus Cloacimonadales bacterium]